jgi:hypothetical protein
MAATLDVTITWGSGPTIYALQVEEFSVNIRRSPLHQPIPGSDPFQEDFGLSDPQVSIRGILPTVTPSPSTDGTNTICTKDQLEDVVTGQYSNDILLTLGAGTGASTTSVYQGKISNFSATILPGKEEIYWNFTLVLLARFRD